MYHFVHNTDVIELNNRWKESVIDTCKGRMYNIQQGTSHYITSNVGAIPRDGTITE